MENGTAARRAGAAALVACMALAGCSRSGGDTGAAASGGVPAGASFGGNGQAYAANGARSGYGGSYGGGEDRPPAPMFHGEPMWSENRAHSAKENAEYHFERAGSDLGSKTLDDFLTKVHRFGDHPPAGTLKLVRANGDRLQYDPKANLFAVFTREGRAAHGVQALQRHGLLDRAEGPGTGGRERGAAAIAGDPTAAGMVADTGAAAAKAAPPRATRDSSDRSGAARLRAGAASSALNLPFALSV